MEITYQTRKDLPCEKLYELFLAVGWAEGKDTTPEMPEYQGQGIGQELVRRCREACPGSEWLVQTDAAKGFYEKIGFRENGDSFLTIPGRWC